MESTFPNLTGNARSLLHYIICLHKTVLAWYQLVRLATATYLDHNNSWHFCRIFQLFKALHIPSLAVLLTADLQGSSVGIIPRENVD